MKHFPPFKLILLAPLFVFVLTACGSKDKDGQDGAHVQRGEDVLISESEMGQSKWLLSTKTADYYDDKQNIELTFPKLINKTHGKDDASIRADKGTYDLKTGLITLSGKVKGVSLEQGATVKTSQIYYNTQTHKVWTDKPVVLTRGGVSVKGAALEANSDFSEIQLYKQITQLPKELRDFDKGQVEL